MHTHIPEDEYLQKGYLGFDSGVYDCSRLGDATLILLSGNRVIG
jgi:hypothetical protein